MRLLRYSLYPLTMALTIASSLFAASERNSERHEAELNERDYEILEQFLRSKRGIPLEEKANNIAISGDVRTEWRHLNETADHHTLRGGSEEFSKDSRCVPLSTNDFDIEFNLHIRYEKGPTWTHAQLQFDNSAGTDRIDCACARLSCKDSEDKCGLPKKVEAGCNNRRFHGSGACDRLCLKRAFFGYTIFENDCNEFYIEIGRRKLYDVMESEVQFLDRMDGITLNYGGKSCYAREWYVRWLGFLVDERVNQFAWATEIALLGIQSTGWDFKYSFIDWEKRGKDRCGIRNPPGYKYAISQVVVTYNLDKVLGVPSEVYAAGLVNHLASQAARGTGESGKGNNWGCYAGISLGNVKKAGDWSVYLQYERLQQFAVPYDDQGGIGLGNVLDDGCRGQPIQGYQGWKLEGLYAVTDNVSIDTIIEFARSTQKEQHSYSKVELEAIYAF